MKTTPGPDTAARREAMARGVAAPRSAAEPAIAELDLLDAATAQCHTYPTAGDTPRAVAQRRWVAAIDDSPRARAQRAGLSALHGAPPAAAPLPISTAPVQRQLDPETRRVRKEERDDWKTLLQANGFSALQVSKIAASAARSAEMKADFASLIDIDSEIDGLSGLKKQQVAHRKKQIKERIEGAYLHLLDAGQNLLADAELDCKTRLDRAAAAVRTFKARTDRAHKNGQAVAANSKLLQHEKDGPVKLLIAAEYHADIGWLTAQEFHSLAMDQAAQAAVATKAMAPNDVQALEVEKGFINTQLFAWHTVASDGQGTNADGTWGTSSTGSVAFRVTTVNAAVWTALRRWWTRKANAFVTPSDTSTWSLKMDRNPLDDNLSPRFNYHINVA